MIKKILGRTGLEVSQLGYGAMELRGPKTWGGREFTEQQAEEVLNTALDLGINFIDTAPDYGLSEEMIGKYIGSRRNQYYLATKCGCSPRDMGDHVDTEPHVWTRDNILRDIAQSLQRLRTDHVDVLQLHNARPREVLAGRLVETLQDIQRQELATFIGVSTTEPFVREFLEMDVFDVYQLPYSALEPQHEETITTVARAGGGTVIRGGIAQGAPNMQAFYAQRAEIWHAARLDELLDGLRPSEMILRYTLSQPYVDTTIVGTMSVEHLKANVQAANRGPLPDELYDEIRRRVHEVMTISSRY